MIDFDSENLEWVPDIDLSDPARPVHSATAVVGGNREAGRVDFITKWEPNSYCSLHRHLAETVSVVLSGELHVEDMDGTSKTRGAGHYACTPAGRMHWERAGANGCVTFYSLQSADGLAFEVPASPEAPAIFISVSDMMAQNFAPS